MRLRNRHNLMAWLRNLASRLETGEYSVGQVLRLLAQRVSGMEKP